MPLFEYACKSCEHRFEELVRNASVKVPCPRCGSREVARQFSLFGASRGTHPASGPGAAPQSDSGHL